MHVIGTAFLYAGVISLLIGYLGIVFCGFAQSVGRGIVVLLFPILGFGDAMRRYQFLIWLLGAGLAGVAIGGLLVP